MIVLYFALFLLILLVIDYLHAVATNPEIIAWPAVSHCRICEKKVFTWQNREWREYDLRLDKPAHIRMQAFGWGIVHKACRGNPVVKGQVETYSQVH